MITHALMTCRTVADLASEAAGLIRRSAQVAIRERGRFLLTLAGGETPEKTYTLLAQPDRRSGVEWLKTYVFFGDERFVPHDDPRSNYATAQRALLGRVPIPPSQVFAVPTRTASAADSAARYGETLVRFWGPTDDGTPPRFDLVLLGLGEDGHVAGLFPSAAALRVDDAWVTWSPPGVAPPPVDRIRLTYPVLNAARHVAFLVAGERKAAVVQEVLEGAPRRERCPAAGVQPTAGTVTWLVDEAAAALLAGVA